jgi:hypothetical protein
MGQQKITMITFRPMRGSLNNALDEKIEVETIEDLAKHLETETNKIKIEPYCFDDRIEWSTYIVLVNKYPAGFTDGNFKHEKER